MFFIKPLENILHSDEVSYRTHVALDHHVYRNKFSGTKSSRIFHQLLKKSNQNSHQLPHFGEGKSF